MLYIKNDCHDPHYNLAFEEYVLKSLDPKEGFVLLWQNRPSVIIGKFQNTIEEVNLEYVRENNISVVRRITGGGAVYHDLGNLNFSFIEKNGTDLIDFRRFSERIAKTLEKLGIQPEISGRNDITIDGKKFSGSAQYQYRGRTLHHGTILYNSVLDDVQKSLNVKADKIESKGIKSVRSRVTNIADYLPVKVSINEFKNLLLEYLFDEQPVKEYILSPGDLENINKLMTEKYLTWEWNYGSSPSYNIKRTGRFTCGGLEILFNVKKGLIQSCRIYGDFFSNKDISQFENKLIGVRYAKEALASVIEENTLYQYFGPLTKEEIIGCMVE
jgi:lipoate-protein ligase A